MKAIIILVIYIYFNIKITDGKCPSQEIVGVCECYPDSSDIICNGLNITKLDLNKLPDYEFGTLWVNNTAITSISDESLGNSKWKKIYIHNNKNLTTIKANAFRKGPASDLWIKNNPNLQTYPLNDLLSNIIETNYIRLDGNEITILLPKTLNPNSKVIYFDIHNNNLKSVKPETFIGLKHLSYIKLDKNSIDHLYPNSFKFEADENNNRTITVIIDDNHLNSSSFNKGWFSNVPKLTIELSLRNNNLTQLKQEDFDLFLSNKKNKLFFGNNDFICDCNMKWLLDGDFRQNNTFEVGCYEQKQSLFRLNPSELTCTTTSTTNTTEASITTKLTQQSTPTPTTTTTELSTPFKPTDRTEPTTKKP